MKNSGDEPVSVLKTSHGELLINPRASQEEIARLTLDKELGFFWHNRPDLQKQALVKIAGYHGGQVTLARTREYVVVGYVTITEPEKDTRWGQDEIQGLLELGGIEVSRAWRGMGVGNALMGALFAGEAFAGDIVIATGYQWCWDVEPTGLTVREYRNMLNRMFARFGFQLYETDEPNIAWYPDNALVVRVGKKVSPQLLARFKGLLFQRPGGMYVSSEFFR